MTLLQLELHFKAFPAGTKFNYSLSMPFSWRGSYDEVAFALMDGLLMTREHALELIQAAYTQTFIGYKGGEFYYHNHTAIHFEATHSDYSDGDYVSNWIAKIEGTDFTQTQIGEKCY